MISSNFIKQQYLWNIAIQPAVGCSDLKANMYCLGCPPLGEKELWNRTIDQSGTKPNLVAKILATKIGNLWTQATKIGSQH